MRLIDRKTMKEIESHFYGWQYERLEIEQRTREIAESMDYGHRLAKAANGRVTDPVVWKSAKIERAVGRLKKWVAVVDATRKKFAGTPYAEFMTMVYVERQPPLKVQAEMYIGESTYYTWKEHVLQYAAMKACERGLIEV